MNAKSSSTLKISLQAKVTNRFFIEPTHYKMIVNEAAYYQAEQRNFLPGYELLDWLAAEDEILSRMCQPEIPGLTSQASNTDNHANSASSDYNVINKASAQGDHHEN